MKTVVRSFAFFFVALFFASFDAHAQIPDIVPPSPDAAELGKYANTPVGLHTGIPDISVPIYTIKTSQLEVPITMSYHAGGNRVDAIAEWAGLGWSLNAGGVITRTIVGRDDDQGYLNSGVETHHKSDIDANPVTLDLMEWIYFVANGNYDNESDFYFYNFGNHAGKLIFDDNKQPFLIPQEPIKMVYDPSMGTWNVTDEKGVVYSFGGNDGIEVMTVGAVTLNGESNFTFNSSWYLKQITSADGTDKIFFNYDSDAPMNDWATDFSETLGSKCEEVGVPPYMGIVPSTPSRHDVEAASGSYRTITPRRLTSIVFTGGKIEFEKNIHRDDALCSKLNKIRIYKELLKYSPSNTAYELINAFKFNTDYFKNHSGQNLKLKLESIDELGADNNDLAPARSHKFSYNEGTTLPDLGNFYYDWWGLFNRTSVPGPTPTSPIQKELINYGGYIFQVGSADRSPNADAMQIYILNKITYPTGGYTKFEYEPHYFHGSKVDDKSLYLSVGQNGVVDQLFEKTVQFTPAEYGVATINALLSNMTTHNQSGLVFSEVSLSRITSGGAAILVAQLINDPAIFHPSPANLQQVFYATLEKDQTYEFKVRAKGPSDSQYFDGAAYATATISWSENPAALQMAGGLRIKAIKDYTDTTAVPVTRIYKYGPGEDGSGLLMSPGNKLNAYKAEMLNKHKKSGNGGSGSLECYVDCSTTRLHIHASTPQDLTSLSGSPVIYSDVTVYQNSASGPNGKEVYQFEMAPDENMGVYKAYKNGEIQISNSWKGQNMIRHDIYKGYEVELVKEEVNVFDNLLDLNKTTMGTKIGFNALGETACFIPDPPAISDFYIFDYPINTGARKIVSTTVKTYSQSELDQDVETFTTFQYDTINPINQQIFKQITTDSKGGSVENRTYYSGDYLNSPFTDLINKNIISIPIRQEEIRGGLVTKGQITIPDVLGKPLTVNNYETSTPTTFYDDQQSLTSLPPGYVQKGTITYDGTTQNVKTTQKANDVLNSYLWGYQATRPIAKVVNALHGDYAYASFENYNDESNWAYSGALTILGDLTSPTGRACLYLSTVTITNNTMVATVDYTLSYWYQFNTTVNVSFNGGTASPPVSTPGPNGWTLVTYEKVSGATQVTISGVGNIDELRLRPRDAQMTTYTYNVLIGTTSICDTNNVITKYEYDSLQRLVRIIDGQGNIIKSFDYSYFNGGG